MGFSVTHKTCFSDDHEANMNNFYPRGDTRKVPYELQLKLDT